MANVSNEELVELAEAALNSQKLDGFYVGDVGCALVSESGQVFTGACLGTYLGICAEQSAFGAMVSKEGTKIQKIVAVWRSEEGELHALPPCGRCREFMRVMNQDNLEAEVILGKDHSVKLKDLLPFYGWHAEKV